MCRLCQIAKTRAAIFHEIKRLEGKGPPNLAATLRALVIADHELASLQTLASTMSALLNDFLNEEDPQGIAEKPPTIN